MQSCVQSCGQVLWTPTASQMVPVADTGKKLIDKTVKSSFKGFYCVVMLSSWLLVLQHNGIQWYWRAAGGVYGGISD